jgi:hypothetical protein
MISPVRIHRAAATNEAWLFADRFHMLWVGGVGNIDRGDSALFFVLILDGRRATWFLPRALWPW